MRRYAISISVIGFFVLAAIGCACDVPLLTCSLRALAGAVALYVMTKIVGRLILNILVETIVRDGGIGKQDRERASQ